MEQQPQLRSHPDLRDQIAQDMSKATGRQIAAQAVRVLQQRTLRDFNLLGHRRTESAAVAVLHEDLYDTLVVSLASLDAVSAQWTIQARASTAIGRPPVKPFVGRTLIGGGRIIVGALVSSSDIHAVRVALPDGTTTEDRVSGDSVLVFVPLNSVKQAGAARVQLLDAMGTEIAGDTHIVDPQRG